MRTILAGMLLCTALAVADGHAQSRIEPAYEPTEEDVERGKALTVAGNCAGCHTADPARPFAGGKRIDSPFGAIYSANLTPDRETGLGAWTDDDFLRALRLGRGTRRHALLPGLSLSAFHPADPPGHSRHPRPSGDADTR